MGLSESPHPLRDPVDSDNTEVDQERCIDKIQDFQNKAELLISRCDPLPVIALDLDYTIWPANCYEHTQPPYSAVCPEDGNFSAEFGAIGRIYCTDARTKMPRTVELYDEVLSILQWCKERKISLTICSKSPSRSVVEGLLRAFGLWDWFVFPQVFNSRSKSYHFRNLSEATGLKMRDFLFYDDDIANVNMCTKLGVTCHLVDKAKGLTWKTLLQGLEVFQSKQLCRKSFSAWISGSPTQPANKPTTPRRFSPQKDEAGSGDRAVAGDAAMQGMNAGQGQGQGLSSAPSSMTLALALSPPPCPLVWAYTMDSAGTADASAEFPAVEAPPAVATAVAQTAAARPMRIVSGRIALPYIVTNPNS